MAVACLCSLSFLLPHHSCIDHHDAMDMEHGYYAALPRQKEVMTIFMFLRYGTKTNFCLIYPIFIKKFRIFDV